LLYQQKVFFQFYFEFISVLAEKIQALYIRIINVIAIKEIGDAKSSVSGPSLLKALLWI
jgi:hypothetical protein